MYHVTLMTPDVAIVGAGPAGARAAFVLARAGARVAIFDGSHPREKPCGGGITGRALALVADAVTLGDCPATVVRSVRFTRLRTSGASAAHASTTVDGAAVPLDGGALVVASRAAFDRALLTAAEAVGATLVPSRVTDVTIEPTGVRLDTTAGVCRAGFVIGADGANSLVRRRAYRPFDRHQISIATGFFAHGVTSDEIVIELVPDPPGYIWSFPRPDHLAIGICAQADAGVTAATLRAQTARWIHATGLVGQAPLVPYSWPIPSLAARDFEQLETAGPRWALIGDAAGLVDPITREGIFFALSSGQWVADALGDGANAAHTYASRVRAEAAPELARAARLKAGFFRPAFTELLMRALHHSAGIRAVMADLVAGEQSYAGLKWRLLCTLEVGLAWRALVSRT
jgi:geranylgeranyl reductase family protein